MTKTETKIREFVICLLAAATLGGNAAGQAATTSELLQKGIYLQETIGDLDGAMKVYRQIALMARESRANAAQAEYRLGVCLHKRGRREEAIDTFHKLIREYPEQATVVAQARDFLLKAVNITDNPCQSLENELQGDLGNVGLHEKILYCYFKAKLPLSVGSGRWNELENVRVEHLLWFIQHAPENEYTGPGASVFANYDAENYVRVKQEWMRQVKTHPGNANVLVNAGRFIDLTEQDEALELGSKAHAADPKNVPAIQYLASLYERKMHYDKSELKAKWAHQALQLRQQQLDAVAAEKKNDLCLFNELATDAFEAEDDVLAQKYAEEALQQGQQQNKFYCAALHHGNLMLGRIALKKGNLEEAKSRLLEAGKASGSFSNPNMMLAKELLEKGQREIVLQYLDECANFWKNGGDKLNQWRIVIRGGGIPNFGVNLVE